MIKPVQPNFIKTKKIILRKLKLSDAPEIYKQFNHPHVLKWLLFQPPKNFSLNDETEYLKKILRKNEEKKAYSFGITLPPRKNLVGIISLEKFNWENSNAQIGYWLSKEHWGQGIISNAVKLILNFAFKKIKLHRVYGAVFADNFASQKVLEKNGFLKEGITRHATFRYRRWHDKIRYGILNS